MLLVLSEGNPSVTVGFPSQRPVTERFDVFFDQRLNKQLSKQSRCQGFDMPLRSLSLHCIFSVIICNAQFFISLIQCRHDVLFIYSPIVF